MSAFSDAVVAVVAGLGPGEVVSYGEVAAEAGAPGAARAVGHALRKTDGLPWWRVVTATGRLVPGLEREQARLLAAEGVAVRGDRIAGTRRRVAAQRDRHEREQPLPVKPEGDAAAVQPLPEDGDSEERA